MGTGAQIQVEVPSGPGPPALNGTASVGQVKAERFKLGKLQIKLTDALTHLQATGSSVGEANSLSDNAFIPERCGLTVLTAMLTKRLEESDERQRELDMAIENKRQRTE